MEFIIVTGLSGSGKSKAVDVLEDIGFFCVDNMPPQLVPAFTQLLMNQAEQPTKAAIVIDIRAGNSFNDLFASLDTISEMGCNYKVLFIDASNEVLVNRFKETRRKHPLSSHYRNSMNTAIEAEREILKPIRMRADYFIDTTRLNTTQMKERVANLFLDNITELMPIHVMSFGYKYGMPVDADLVFDVRCLPNPFYVEELKHLTGLDKSVRDYVMKYEQSKNLIPKLLELLDYLIPLYRTEGKSELNIAVGCTGGKHRSVTLAEILYKHFYENPGTNVTVTHRDINKK